MAQVALSFVALASAGMFLRSLANARGIDPGFDGSRLAVLGINPGTQGFDEARTRELYRRVTERLSGVAGVEAVTLSTSVPLFGGGFGRTVFRDGQDPKDPRNGRMTQMNQVAGGYFEAIGIPVVKGRGITSADRAGSTPVAVINEAMAKQIWPNEDPVGRTLRIFGNDTPWQIVGVAKTIKYNFIGEDADRVPLPAARTDPRLAGRGAGARVGRSVAGAGHRAARAAAARAGPAAPQRQHLCRRVRPGAVGAADGGVAARHLRGAGAAAGRHRALRRARLLGEPAHARAGHPPGARRARGRRAADGGAPGRRARLVRAGAGPAGVVGAVAGDHASALQRGARATS